MIKGQKYPKNFDEVKFLSSFKMGKESSCWNWLKAKSSTGYGTFWNSELRKNEKAHRVMWRYIQGYLSSDICVLHKCDNPLCVNPSHLFLGTYQDNSDDKMKKSRMKPNLGSKHGCSKLTESQVIKKSIYPRSS